MEGTDLGKLRVLNELTQLANNLIVGGLARSEPDIVLIGNVLMTALCAVENNAGIELLMKLLSDYTEAHGDQSIGKHNIFNINLN